MLTGSAGLMLALTAAISQPAAAQRATATFSYGFIDSLTLPCDDEGCAETVAFNSESSRLFITDATGNRLRILGLAADGRLTEIAAIDLSPYGAGPNSVAVSGGRVAVAVEADTVTDPGTVVAFDTNGSEQHTVTVGALPDMLRFTPDGRYLLVANEGEPSADYTIDPEGSVSVIDTTGNWSLRTADFRAFNAAVPEGVRVFGPGASVAQDLEPEYIAVAADSATAWISLQENNALAVVDIATATVTDLVGLGLKDHSLGYNSLDTSDRDGGAPGCRLTLPDPQQCIRIRSRPVYGMYQPDAIDAFTIAGNTYIATANEGDARDYDGFSEEARVGDAAYVLDASLVPRSGDLQDKAVLGRLKTTITEGDTDGDGDFDRIYAFGARSFSIRDASGSIVFDSGNRFERRLARLQASGAEPWQDSRSDEKGPEPESVIVGELAGHQLAFIGLERSSGVFVYDVSVPRQSRELGYLNLAAFGDIAPEGLLFIAQSDRVGWLIAANEVSNTVSVYEVRLEPRGRARR